MFKRTVFSNENLLVVSDKMPLFRHLKSTKKTLFFALLLQIAHFIAVTPQNVFISDYKCTAHPDGLAVTFACSSNASADISPEVQSSERFGRCKNLDAARSTVSTVAFTNCDLACLPGPLIGTANLKVLNLSRIALESIAADDLRNMSWACDSHLSLDLSSNRLTAIDEPVFGELNGLKTLYLSNNSIRALNAGTFSGLAKLTKLHAEHNNIGHIANGTFAGLPDLATLHLSHNQLGHLNADTFRGLDSLRCLHLQRNSIGELPSGAFAGLRRLETLDLSHNRLRALGQAFGGDNRVRHLDVSFNRIGSLGAGDFVHLQWLEHLNLSHSRVESMAIGSMSPLWKLGTLDLSHNLLKTINFDIFLPSFRFLGALHLDGNQLAELNGRFDVLFPQLAELMLAHNRFNCTYLATFLATFAGNHRAIFANPATVDTNIGGITCTIGQV